MAEPPRNAVPRVSVVIVTFRCADIVVRALRSLRSQTWPSVEVIVVDNASGDELPAVLAADFPEVRFHSLVENVGFAEGCNIGVAHSEGELILLLNPDAWLEPDGIAGLAHALIENEDLGIVGGVVLHPDGAIQEAGNRLDRMGFPVPRRVRPERELDRDVFFVSGCALMISRADWTRLGGLDERYFMFNEEVDLCWRMQAQGRDVGVVRDVVVWHIGGATLAGGYAHAGRHRTSARRIYLRERNALATTLKNGQGLAIGLAVLAWAGNVLEALVFLSLRQPQVAMQYPRALLWNLRELPETLRRRRALRASRTRPDRELRGWASGSGKLRVLRGGFPRVDEST